MKYLIRLDDACETMNLNNWLKMEAILDKYNVKPIIAVIPNNEDDEQKIDAHNPNFWDWLVNLEKKGWEIGLHGYNHVYQTKKGGINPIHNRSEFAGVPLEEQKDKLKKGFNILKTKGLNPKIFVAPSHTFDENTLEALRSETDVRVISDTIAFRPYIYDELIFIPQQLGHARKVPLPGIYTFCYHPNTMNDKGFLELENFLSKYQTKIGFVKELSFNDIKSKSIIDKLFSYSYFTFRKFFR